MGRFSDLLNEEFVIGAANVERFRSDPGSLDEILQDQAARGLGSARALRASRRARLQRENEAAAGPGWMGVLGLGVLAAIAAHWLGGHRE